MPAGAQYQAILELAFPDEAAERRLLASAAVGALAPELGRHVAALHTYPEVATYALVYDGRPILAARAWNQVSPEVVRLLDGGDAQPPSALPAPAGEGDASKR